MFLVQKQEAGVVHSEEIERKENYFFLQDKLRGSFLSTQFLAKSLKIFRIWCPCLVQSSLYHIFPLEMCIHVNTNVGIRIHPNGENS